MTQTHLNAFSMALLGVAFTLLALQFPPAVFICTRFRPQLPEAHDPQILFPTKSDLRISLTAGKRGDHFQPDRIWIGTDELTREWFRVRMAELRPAKNRRVTLAADPRLPFGDVLDVVRAARAAGYEHVFLATYASSDSRILAVASRRWLKAHVVD